MFISHFSQLYPLLRFPLCLLFLGCCTLWDLRCLHIPGKILYLGALLSGLYSLTGLLIKAINPAEFLVSLCPAAIFWLLFLLTRHSIGSGDIWALAVTGLCLGAERSILTLGLSLFLSFWGALVSYIKNRQLKARLPFLPFLFSGCVTLFLLEVCT